MHSRGLHAISHRQATECTRHVPLECIQLLLLLGLRLGLLGEGVGCQCKDNDGEDCLQECKESSSM